MKQKYSYLLIVIVSIFSVSSTRCAERSNTDVQKDFDFIMESLKTLKYKWALQDANGRWGIEDFNEGHPIFKMEDQDGNTMLHAILQAAENVKTAVASVYVIEALSKRCPDLLSLSDLKKVLSANNAFLILPIRYLS